MIIFGGNIISNGSVAKNEIKVETFYYPIVMTTISRRTVTSTSYRFNCSTTTEGDTALTQCTVTMKNISAN